MPRWLEFSFGFRRVAAELRGVRRELTRIADALEDRGGRGGASLRMHYRDTRPTAVDEAGLLMQSDADFAEFERQERALRAAGRDPGLEDDIMPDLEPWR